MRSPRECLFLTRDFFRYLSGKDYFRQKQGLGLHFEDSRCYYNDLRKKVFWNGAYVDGVPALYITGKDEHVVSPCDVLLYGLGNIDLYFQTGDTTYRTNTQPVTQWLLKNLLPDGYWDSKIQQHNPLVEYHSGNSCMNQGLALSYLVRIIKYGLADQNIDVLRDVMNTVAENMVLEKQDQGTALRIGRDIYLCEYCNKDDEIVLNGWIFGIFGLLDYNKMENNKKIKQITQDTLCTVRKELPNYQMKNGWSFYSNRKRISSPFYQELHISLFDAMFRIGKWREFEVAKNDLVKGNSKINRVRYTYSKIVDKLTDKQAYISQ